MSESAQMWRQYWTSFAEVFAHPLRAAGVLSEFVTNSNVTGAYAEAWIRGLITSMSPHFRVSTGAIIRPMDKKEDLRSIPQLDAIIWDPSELPAIFEQGDFALVPFNSARAIIETKRTCSDVSKLQDQLKRQQKRLIRAIRCNVLGIVVSHELSLFDGVVDPGWLEQEGWGDSPAMTRLISGDGSKVDADGVFVLIYFLAQIAGHRSAVS